METGQLIRRIKDEKIALFGTGFVAERFYRALAAQGLQGQIECCFVTGSGERAFHALPVRALNELTEPCELLCCVAVHEALRGDIEKAIEGKFRRVEWIYPHLWRLAFGEPLRERAMLPLRNILAEQSKENFWITLRYALAEGWESGDYALAQGIYRKAQGVFSARETVENRISRFRALYRRIKENGFDDRYPILIDSEYRVIDGLHRLALAALLGVKEVPCVVFEAKPCYDDFLGEENRLTKAAQSASLDAGEQSFLEAARERLRQKAGVCAMAPSVSVILPVYNVEDYIDECMQSLQRQTFCDFEMILIDDGSTDGSYDKCVRWAGADARVRVFSRANAGVASARNLGLEKARGEFIAFIDPDDWVEDTYLEKLHAAITRADADFAECDLWRYDNRTGKKIYRSCYGRLDTPYTLREHMKYGPTATYKAMSRRALWIDNGVRIPDCHFESPAVYSLMLALSNRVVNVREALYNYRRFRENSLVENYAHEKKPLGVETMAFLIGEFKRTGLYDAFGDTLEGVVKYRLSDILALQFHRRNETDFRELAGQHRTFLARTFPQGENRPYITWGGYNLNRIMSHMRMLHDPYTRFNFSSIIGVTNEGGGSLPQAEHPNRYRKMMIDREFSQRVWSILDEEKPAFLFLDLLEERFDMLELDGRYLTISDAFEGCRDADGMLKRGRRIARDSEECDRLFKERARRFFERICQTLPEQNIFILESYLCESVGSLERQRPFEQQARIARSNRILKGYYGFLRWILPRARFFCFAGEALYFTDEKYEYGAIPSHLNELENQRIAERMEESVYVKGLDRHTGL